ncbi:hypothetical protein IFM89_024714 [Coptis chinensis]|uniref:4-alpha-glucanotransferase n=1 Tax=Coptis chinensis TaxID=261450 RepID=A0A835IFH5_9MAGN|nr:hypothetical protein IFM89_024714 [Coptis chinensis]
MGLAELNHTPDTDGGGARDAIGSEEATRNSDLRRVVMDAATIAGLRPLRLFHETTATALAYGVYKTDLPENDQVNVVFVDVGHASMQVCIAGFKKGQLKVLAHSFDSNLGGRDFDEVWFQHFVGKFKGEYKIDVNQNARACLRLRAACEKLKKMLSANPETPLNIECWMDEKDVRGFIKRDEFENISLPILERVKVPLEKAIADAGLTVENIHIFKGAADPKREREYEYTRGSRYSDATESLWQAECVMKKKDFPIKYKYCLSDRADNVSVEVGSHRDLAADSKSASQPRYIFLYDGIFRDMPWRGVGVAIPMFSVRSKEDLGVGEFLDLKLLVDLAVESGFHLVQLLPVNDTSVDGMWWDSYPYSSLSVFALHPLYLRVQALSEKISLEIKQEILETKERLDGTVVDYEATLDTKLSIAKKIYFLEKESILTSTAFQKFFSENEEWLKPCAAFCFLRDFFETSDHFTLAKAQTSYLRAVLMDLNLRAMKVNEEFENEKSNGKLASAALCDLQVLYEASKQQDNDLEARIIELDVGEKLSMLEKEWSFTLAEVMEMVQNLDASVGRLPDTSNSTVQSDAINVGSPVTDSVDAATKRIEDLQQKLGTSSK